jgi:hypothetical protein
MFINALAGAIDAANPKQFDYLSRQLWQAHAAGHIPDQDAQSLAERLHSRRGDSGVAQGALFRLANGVTPAKGQNAPRAFLRTPESKSPDRRRSIERRRRLAASGPMPPAMSAVFTVGELAVLRIVGDEVAARGTCDRSLAEIAARAGVCRKLAQLTLRLAARQGLVSIQRRPRPGRKNLSNVVRIISAEWTAWLKRGNRAAWVARSAGAVLDQVQGEKNYLPRAQIQKRSFAREEPGGRRLRGTVENGGPRHPDNHPDGRCVNIRER